MTSAPALTHMHLAGMASNRGRNLLNVADRLDEVEFAVILTNDADAPVLEGARERGIPTEIVERAGGEARDGETRGGEARGGEARGAEAREDHERRVLDALDAYDVDLVCLDGYMRVLTDTFLDAAPTTLNVHPSLLPAFPGMHAHEDVLDAGARITGCTVHVVTEEVDGGPIVTQEPVPVYEGDDASTLKDRVLYEGEFRAYPRAIRWFAEGRVTVTETDAGDDGDGLAVSVDADGGGDLPARRLVSNDRGRELRYGENPHQDAAIYVDPTCEEASVVHADQLNEGAKALSYNNYNDADGALDLVKEFDAPAAAVIKHANPAGCATADTVAAAYDRALRTDAMSAFGGIVALNRDCDRATAEQITDSFKEVVVAPGYTDDALAVLSDSENLRVLDVGPLGDRDDHGRQTHVEKPLVGGRLVQERDTQHLAADDLEVVTERAPSDEELAGMLFGWHVVKHVTSNGIVFAQGTETVGVGMGQVSRVDAVHLAGRKAREHADGKGPDGSVMASDAFFPFPDGVEAAAEYGISAVVQPGGSVNDDDVIAACDDRDIAMCFTGQRCFKHD